MHGNPSMPQVKSGPPSVFLPYICHGTIWLQSIKIVDGSASKPALRQDTGYRVEKTYHEIAPYLGAFGAYLMPQ